MKNDPANTRYRALLVDNDNDRRRRLKEAALALYQFESVHTIVNLGEGLEALKAHQGCDVVFISQRYPIDQIRSFITNAKESIEGRDAAYVMIMGSSEKEKSTIAESMMKGADGFLFEPYSVESLLEITTLAEKVKKERSRVRIQQALKLLLEQMSENLDLLAGMRASGYEAGITAKNFREICSSLQTLDDESLQMYYELALKHFEQCSPPSPIQKKKMYTGASQRVKKLQERKALSEMQTQFEKKKSA